MRPRRHPDVRDIAAEIVRRVNAAQGVGGYVIRLSDPPTLGERLQLMAARLERRPIVIMPHKCKTMDEWVAKYTSLAQAAGSGAEGRSEQF